MIDSKNLVAGFYAAFNVNDGAAFRRLLSPDWQDHPNAPGQAPGPEGLIGVVGAFRTAFDGLVITPEVMVAEGGYVVARIRLEGRHVEDWAGHKASGRSVIFHGMDMHRLEHGRIAETWHFEDYGGLDV